MNKKNLTKLQKLLQYYPQSKDIKADGFYGDETIEAVNSFYDNYYWTEERRMQKLIDLHGENYIMQSELEGMKAYSSKY